MRIKGRAVGSGVGAESGEWADKAKEERLPSFSSRLPMSDLPFPRDW